VPPLDHGDLDVTEDPFVAVFAVCWSVRHSVLARAVDFREQAERDELRMEADLAAERAADVLRDEAQLVETRRKPAPSDRADPGHLVVAVHRPLAGAAVVLDERAAVRRRDGGRTGRSIFDLVRPAFAPSQSPQSKTPDQTTFEPASCGRASRSRAPARRRSAEAAARTDLDELGWRRARARATTRRPPPRIADVADATDGGA
jgi:hypothetical protein